MSFLSDHHDDQWKAYMLQIMLSVKWLYDRGFDVRRVTDFDGDGHFGVFLDILFGDGNVTWKRFIKDMHGYDWERLNDESGLDEYCWEFSIYHEREHFFLNIQIPILKENASKLRPRHYKKLMDLLLKILPYKDPNPDIDISDKILPWWSLFEDVYWLKDKDTGRITGIEIHFVEISPNWQWDEPYFINEYKDIINFYDALQKTIKEVINKPSIKRWSDNPRLAKQYRKKVKNIARVAC